MTKNSRISMASRAFCLGILLLFSQIPVFAQESNQNQSETTVQTEAQGVPANQNWKWSEQGYEQNQNQPSTVALFFKMVFALGLVLVIAYLAIRVLKRGSKLVNSDDPFLRHVSHLPLSASRSVDVVTILDHAYILGVSDNAVNLVGEITDKELVNSMNIFADKKDSTKRPRSFDDILSIFMPGARSAQNQSVYGSSAQNAADLLQRQRNRLNEEE